MCYYRGSGAILDGRLNSNPVPEMHLACAFTKGQHFPSKTRSMASVPLRKRTQNVTSVANVLAFKPLENHIQLRESYETVTLRSSYSSFVCFEFSSWSEPMRGWARRPHSRRYSSSQSSLGPWQTTETVLTNAKHIFIWLPYYDSYDCGIKCRAIYTLML